MAVNNDLKLYGEDDAITSKWDTLQRDLHCCGGSGYIDGYLNYQSTPIGARYSVPNSCCHDRDSNCGEGILDPRRGGSSDEARRQKIYVTGCLTILKDKLQVKILFLM